MNKGLSGKQLSEFLNQSLSQGRELWEQVIPDKELLQKYEHLLAQKFEDLKSSQSIEELIKPLRKKLEKSCLKPLEAKNLNEFSLRVMSVLRVQAKKKRKILEKKMGIKVPKVASATRKRRKAAKKSPQT